MFTANEEVEEAEAGIFLIKFDCKSVKIQEAQSAEQMSGGYNVTFQETVHHNEETGD